MTAQPGTAVTGRRGSGALDRDGPRAAAGALVITTPYLATGTPRRCDDGVDRADEHARPGANVTCGWQHPLPEVVQVLLDARLVLTSLAEHTTIPWRPLPGMVEGGYALADGRERLPLTFSLTARRPSHPSRALPRARS